VTYEFKCFMVVQVVSRYEDGQLKEWYDGDQKASLAECRDEIGEMVKEYPTTRFQIIQRIITEIGKERMGA
jgi:hypothetical protein